VAQLHRAPCSNGEASPNIIIQDAEEGAKGSKKRHKQHHLETAPAIDNYSSNNKQAGSSDVVHAAAAIGNGKWQARPPTDHFEKLLEESFPNHAYHVKHNLRDCDMVNNFMASGSLAWGTEVDEVPDKGDMMPFLREDMTVTIYDGRPLSGMRRVSNPSPGSTARGSWGCRNAGDLRTQVFFDIFVH
jgi:hypothetical protein